MRRGFSLSALLAAVLAAAGCTYGGLEYIDSVLTPNAESNLGIATRTVAQLRTLAVGQSRDEVLQRMGQEPVEGCLEWSWESREFYLRHNGYLRCVKTEPIRSPYRTASLESGGVRYEALFYYTGGTGPEGGIGDEHVTPVLIGDGKLVGWGWDHPLIRQLGPSLSATQSAVAPALPGGPPPPQPQR